jgi:transposase
MPAMDYWAKAPLGRDQMTLFSPTLDEMIDEAHPVRLLDEILATCDWSEWEAHYHGKRGQPPIRPRVVASVLLYGLTRGLRSSRVLEYCCGNNIDFMWLVERRTIDHSTICDFRREFHKPLKALFRQVCKIALTMGLIRLGEVTLDGTRVKASNGRYRTLTAEKLEERLRALDEQLEQMLREAEQADRAEQQSFAGNESSTQLPPALEKLKQRKGLLQQALEKARVADKARAKEGSDPKKNPAQVPMTDLDSKVMPNKEGGYAPNYTPLASADVHRGFLVQVDVVASVNEQTSAVAMMDGIAEDLGQTPERLLADGAYPTGQNLADLEAREVELFSPVKSNQPQEGNPARRDDATQPVPPEQWNQLPRNPQSKKLDKSCFVYVEAEDAYYCPQGQRLDYEQTKSDVRSGVRVRFRVYRCAACAGCPLASACLQDSTKHGRQISRDLHENKREALAAKMAIDAGRAMYAKRFHAGEVPFAILKRIMGLRQFLLRGLENVRTEWLWACTAFNLNKLQREIARLRAHFAQLELEGV